VPLPAATTNSPINLAAGSGWVVPSKYTPLTASSKAGWFARLSFTVSGRAALLKATAYMCPGTLVQVRSGHGAAVRQPPHGGKPGCS
jgi:hypothetical protein